MAANAYAATVHRLDAIQAVFANAITPILSSRNLNPHDKAQQLADKIVAACRFLQTTPRTPAQQPRAGGGHERSRSPRERRVMPDRPGRASQFRERSPVAASSSSSSSRSPAFHIHSPVDPTGPVFHLHPPVDPTEMLARLWYAVISFFDATPVGHGAQDVWIQTIAKLRARTDAVVPHDPAAYPAADAVRLFPADYLTPSHFLGPAI